MQIRGVLPCTEFKEVLNNSVIIPELFYNRKFTIGADLKV